MTRRSEVQILPPSLRGTLEALGFRTNGSRELGLMWLYSLYNPVVSTVVQAIWF